MVSNFLKKVKKGEQSFFNGKRTIIICHLFPSEPYPYIALRYLNNHFIVVKTKA